jgi:hypothetical protein
MRLMKRDEGIFRFLLDQKFAPLDAIYLRFFDRRTNSAQPLPPQLFVTRQRLGLLKKEKFITTDRVYTEAKSLYLLSTKGYHYLKQLGAEPPYAIPTKEVDFRNYAHDLRVTYCRVALERASRAHQWISERRIRMKGYVVNGESFPGNVIPDGIFISSKGERVAFELECSERKISRFANKAMAYQQLFYRKLLDRVLWIGLDATIRKSLVRAAETHPKFTVGTYDEFSQQLFPGGVR